MLFGRLSSVTETLAPLIIEAVDIEYVDSWRYLGFLIQSGGNFAFSAKNNLRSFYRASNSILNVFNKRNEPVQLKLSY